MDKVVKIDLKWRTKIEFLFNISIFSINWDKTMWKRRSKLKNSIDVSIDLLQPAKMREILKNKFFLCTNWTNEQTEKSISPRCCTQDLKEVFSPHWSIKVVVYLRFVIFFFQSDVQINLYSRLQLLIRNRIDGKWTNEAHLGQMMEKTFSIIFRSHWSKALIYHRILSINTFSLLVEWKTSFLSVSRFDFTIQFISIRSTIFVLHSLA